MNEHPNNGHPIPAMRRGIKSIHHSQTKAEWKEVIRRGCLERAQIARRQRLRRSRLHDPEYYKGACPGGHCRDDYPGTSNIHSDIRVMIGPSKRGRDESNADWNISDYDDEVMADCTGDSGIDSNAALNGPNYDQFDSEGNAVDTAKTLVELELQRALTGMQHHHLVCPLDGGTPWKKTHGGGIISKEINEFQAIEATDNTDNEYKEEYKMSHEEFLELLSDVTEELLRDGECLHHLSANLIVFFILPLPK
jgi:hypothetical protein